MPGESAGFPPPRIGPAAAAMLIVAAGAGALVLLMPFVGAPSRLALAVADLAQLAAAATAATACFRAARRQAQGERLGWALLGSAATSWGLGQFLWSWWELVQGVGTPIPSLADVGFLLWAPLAMAGLLSLAVMNRAPIVSAALVLDGVLATLAVFVLAWPLMLEGLFLAQPDSLTAAIIVAYPLSDIVLLGMATGVLMRGRAPWRSPVGLLYAGFAAIAVADIGLAVGVIDGSYVTGGVLDLGWILGFPLVAAAAFARPTQAPVILLRQDRARQDTALIAGRVFPIATVLLGFFGFAWAVADGNLPGRPLRIAMALLIVAALSRQTLFTSEFIGAVRQRETAFDELRRSQRAVRVLSRCNAVVIRATDEASLLKRVCDLLVVEGGYRMAWIGEAHDEEEAGVAILAHAGVDASQAPLQGVRSSGPARLAMAEGRSQVAQDLLHDPAMMLWRPSAVAGGFASSCAIPITLGGRRGALMVCAAEPQAFARDEVDLLQDLAAELGHGLAALRDRRATETSEAARREALANYAGIVENSNDGILQSTPGGQLLFANQAAARMLGYESAAQLRSGLTNLQDIYVEPAARALFVAQVHNGDRTPFETRLRRRDDTVFWAALRAKLVTTPSGQDQLISTLEDITDRRQAQESREALARQQREVTRLEELNKMRMDFLNTAAHDLKTPLTPLKLQMATLRVQGLGPKQTESLDLMDRNIGRFQVLIEDMLDAARLQSGRLTLRRQPTALVPLVQEAIASFKESAKQGRLQVATDFTAPADLRIDADPMKCMQVLMNLVSNAVKYTPPGGRIRIAIEATGREAVVSVQDSGVGLSPEQLGHLFEPFVRLHEGRPGIAKGTGLGMYISKGIVESHGGRMWAESQGPDQGSTFYVAWPLAGTKPAAAA